MGGTGTYTITGLDSSPTYGGSSVTNPTSITAGQDTYIYMKHSDEVYIGKTGNLNEIQSRVTYRVIEEDATDYTTEINSASGKDSGSLTTNLTSNLVEILNEKESQVPTGRIIRVLPYIVLILVVITGFIFFIMGKKKSKKEENID